MPKKLDSTKPRMRVLKWRLFSLHARKLLEFLAFLFSKGLKHHKFCYSYD